MDNKIEVEIELFDGSKVGVLRAVTKGEIADLKLDLTKTLLKRFYKDAVYACVDRLILEGSYAISLKRKK